MNEWKKRNNCLYDLFPTTSHRREEKQATSSEKEGRTDGDDDFRTSEEASRSDNMVCDNRVGFRAVNPSNQSMHSVLTLELRTIVHHN
mmetsp:Transcript_21759/g.29580  ORF Transcript_21759/g.29580 Transcript_21759/m.29580 type:complete len:88 (+) Transcript_21759:667-930(+)